jgi:predicted nucleic acid-binding protein
MHAVDSSVLIASLVASEAFHQVCLRLLEAEPHSIFDHALTETFNTLTGGKIKPRFQSSDAARLISANIEDDTRVLELPLQARLAAFDEAESRGVRGGAIYDYLHLAAARHHGMEKFYTLNMSHFQSFWRPGDPAIVHP